MASFERTGRAETGREAMMHGMPIEAPEVQATLMLFAHRKAHRNEPNPPIINLMDPEKTDVAVQSSAGDEWVEASDDTVSRALVFQAFREKYPHRQIDIWSEDALEEFLIELDKEKEVLQLKSKLH